MDDLAVAKQKPPCVVLDTNVWRKELLHDEDAALRLAYVLYRAGGRIGLPEVVREELHQLAIDEGRAAANALQEAGLAVTSLTGRPYDTPMPTDAELQKPLSDRLNRLSTVIVDVLFTLEHAKAAMRMVVQKLPPNEGKEQFRDSAIWQAVLTLCRDYRVHFVTNDRAFYSEKSNPSRGLAPALLEESRTYGVVRIWSELDQCQRGLAAEGPSLDKGPLLAAIVPMINPQLEAGAKRVHLAVQAMRDGRLETFSAVSGDRVPVDYDITFGCEAAPPTGGTLRQSDPRAVVRGSFSCDLLTGSITDHVLEDITFMWNYGSRGGGADSRCFDKRALPFARPPVSMPWRDLID